MNITQYIDLKRKQVDRALERYVPEQKNSLAEHVNAMRYSLFAAANG